MPETVPDRRCRWRRSARVAGDDRVGQRGRAGETSRYRRRQTAAELPLTVQLVRVVVPPIASYKPPPCAGGVAADGAVGQRGSARVASVAAVVRPPPSVAAELPLMVQSVSVSRAPSLNRPPPLRGGVAADGGVGQRDVP